MLEKKFIRNSAIATIMIAWSLQTSATDFGLENNLLTVTSASSSENLKVRADGTATPSQPIPIAPGNYGIPSFSFGLNTSNILTGEHIFWAAIEITGDNNDKYLRVFLDEVFISVADDGTFIGEIKTNNNLTVRVESGGEFIQIELDDQASKNVSFSGQKFQFNASNLLELLGAADGQSALWQRITEDFDREDSYSYKIYLGPRHYGVQGAKIGTTNADSFTAFPLTPTAFLDDVEAYVVQGSFNTTLPSAIDDAINSLPAISNIIGPPGSESVTLRGGVNGNSSEDFFKQAAFSIGETISLEFLLTPAPNHVGTEALIVLGIVLQSDPNTIYLLSSDSALLPFTGQQMTGFAQLTLDENHLLTAPPGGNVLLTPGLEDVYQFYIGYQLLATGELFYGAEPIILEVN